MISIKDSLNKKLLNTLNSFKINRKYYIKNNTFTGNSISKKLGSSLEFSDYKAYSHGDDLRNIDWNIYARTDKLYLKQFLQEKTQKTCILLDSSISMNITEMKSYKSRLICFCLYYLYVNEHHSVSIFSVNSNHLNIKNNLTKKSNLLDVIKFIDDISYNGNTDFQKFFSSGIFNKNKYDNIIFISDFFSQDNYEKIIKTLSLRTTFINLIQLMDKEEINPDYNGNFKFIDSETQEEILVGVNKKIYETYVSEVLEHRNKIKKICNYVGGNFNSFLSDTNILDIVKSSH